MSEVDVVAEMGDFTCRDAFIHILEECKWIFFIDNHFQMIRVSFMAVEVSNIELVE